LRVVGGGEEHAFVARGFLIFAYAAWLCGQITSQLLCHRFEGDWVRTLTFAAASPFGLRSAAALLGGTAVDCTSGSVSLSGER
jgi:hypothetical protein